MQQLRAFTLIRVVALHLTFIIKQIKSNGAKHRIQTIALSISHSMFAPLVASVPHTHHPDTDITAEDVANGIDMQGIPWYSMPFKRADYRATRSRPIVSRPAARFFDFSKNMRGVKCHISHFQLRNLAWATSNNDVFVAQDAAVVHWDGINQTNKYVLRFNSGRDRGAAHLRARIISTMVVKHALVIAGGFNGELVVKNLNKDSIVHDGRISEEQNAIMNAIDIFENSIITGSNDCTLRCFDLSTFEQQSCFQFPTAVNHAARQPGGKIVAVASDDYPIHVVDAQNGDRIADLHAHKNSSFATGWHPDGRLFATGSQDRTCRLWDVRNMSQPVNVLSAHSGAVRSLRFSSCGRFLAMAETTDFVHLFDVNNGQCDSCQLIDLFGEIAGIALTPCAQTLYIAMCDQTYSGLVQFKRVVS